MKKIDLRVARIVKLFMMHKATYYGNFRARPQHVCRACGEKIDEFMRFGILGKGGYVDYEICFRCGDLFDKIFPAWED